MASKINMGTATLESTGSGKITISLQKAMLDFLEMYSGSDVNVIGYLNPTEIVIKPKSVRAGQVDSMISESISRKPWGLLHESDDE